MVCRASSSQGSPRKPQNLEALQTKYVVRSMRYQKTCSPFVFFKYIMRKGFMEFITCIISINNISKTPRACCNILLFKIPLTKSQVRVLLIVAHVGRLFAMGCSLSLPGESKIFREIYAMMETLQLVATCCLWNLVLR